MSNFSNYTADAFLNWFKGSDMPSAPAVVYVALFDGDPGDDGEEATDAVEVTGTIRPAGRVAVTFGSIAGKSIANSADVDFGDSAGACHVTNVALFDDSTEGNYLGGHALVAPKDVEAGAPVKFAAGDLTITA